jgi:hypothetical protein
MTENFRVEGFCSICNSPLIFMAGKQIKSNVWMLLEPIKCSHCGFTLTTVLQDNLSRFWGRSSVYSGWDKKGSRFEFS